MAEQAAFGALDVVGGFIVDVDGAGGARTFHANSGIVDEVNTPVPTGVGVQTVVFNKELGMNATAGFDYGVQTTCMADEAAGMVCNIHQAAGAEDRCVMEIYSGANVAVATDSKIHVTIYRYVP